MVNKHCCYGICTSDSRYPEKLPKGTYFLNFAKPGKVNEGMKKWQKDKQAQKTERAKRWIHTCGRKDFHSITQITKDTYICSLHLIDPSDKSQDPIIATSSIERTTPKRTGRKRKNIDINFQNENLDRANKEPCVSDECLPSSSRSTDKSTQTVRVEKAVLAARIENKILRNKMLLGGQKKKRKGKNRCISNQFTRTERNANILQDYFLNSSTPYLNFWALLSIV